VHVRRIQHQRIDRRVGVRERPAVHPVGEIGGEQRDVGPVDAAPERPGPVGHVGDGRSRRHVQVEDLREDVGVDPDVRRHHQVVGGVALLAAAAAHVGVWHGRKVADAAIGIVRHAGLNSDTTTRGHIWRS
jgi:hypothetical protein